MTADYKISSEKTISAVKWQLLIINLHHGKNYCIRKTDRLDRG